MSDGLKPCPHCGHSAHLHRAASTYVKCYNCGCMTRQYAGSYDSDAERATREWNARAERTCNPRSGAEYEMTAQVQASRELFCTCGESLGVDRLDYKPFYVERLCELPNYCPNCGARVEVG